MIDKKYHIVDVFAEQRYAGNQLAVFMDGDIYSDEEMQLLAREMNFSETTFILPKESSESHYKVRIFTPEEEIPFAGHPTLGTAYIIVKELIRESIAEVTLDLKAGKITVGVEYDDRGRIGRLTMKQLQPSFGRVLEASAAADMLGLEEDQIDSRFPVQEVSTGLPFVIVPVKNLASVRSVQVDNRKMFKALEGMEAKAVLAFCPETYDSSNDMNVRVFVEFYGIPEDPATGSANGCLLAYLLKNDYYGGGAVEIRVEQGYEIRRQSILHLSGYKDGEGYHLYVGGEVQHIAVATLITT